MKKLFLPLILVLPLSAQWTTFDPTNWAVNSKNLQQAIQTYQTMMQYKQMAENMAAFVHNPAMFMGQVAAFEQVALNTANRAGVTTSQRAAQLQQAIRMQQVAMQEAQAIQTISHSNMASIGMLANSMADNANQLAAVQQQLQSEQRTLYYQQSRTYQNQSDIISAWRMK